jgi:hypothetical protein
MNGRSCRAICAIVRRALQAGPGTSIVVAVLVLAGCGDSSSAAAPTVVARSTGLQAQIASSDLSVGENRFTFGLLADNKPIKGGSARVEFFAREGNNAVLMTSSVARFNYFALGLKNTAANAAAIELGGVFVTYARFSRSGEWGASIRYDYHGAVRTIQVGFSVSSHSFTLPVGSRAPRSNNPTIAQMPATKLDSGRPPDDMHRLSIRAALATRKPLVVLFATPAFCTSRLCGPEVQVVEQLEARYRGRVNFIHIEIYENADPKYGYAPTVIQWGLRSEPWVFVVDRKGIIAAKFEGATPGSEIEPFIRRAL